jgi:hypothetical protein
MCFSVIVASTLLSQQGSQPKILIVDHLVIGHRTSNGWKKSTPNLGNPGPLQRIDLGRLAALPKVAYTIVDSEINAEARLLSPFQPNLDVAATVGLASIPRPVKILSNSNATYREIVRKALIARKVTKPNPRITRIVSADLDGNGTQEVLIEARSSESLRYKSGEYTSDEYSCVLLRAIVNGKVTTFPIHFDTKPPENGLINFNRIRAVADFDGDKTMEFVVSSDFYEGQSAGLWRFKGGKLTRLISHGDGV